VKGGGPLFARGPELGASWEVVEGVRMLAGSPLVGADEGWIGEIAAGVLD